MMTTFEAISLMIAFAMLIVTLLAYIDRNNKLTGTLCAFISSLLLTTQTISQKSKATTNSSTNWNLVNAISNSFCYFSNGVHRRNRLEMQTGTTMSEEFFTLCYAPLNTQLFELFVCGAFLCFFDECFWKVAMETLGNNL